MRRLVVVFAACLAACSNPPADTGSAPVAPVATPPAYEAQYHDAARALANLETLSSDAFEGRETGTEGNRKAREWIETQLTSLGMSPARQSGYGAPFDAPNFKDPENAIHGTNLVTFIRGSDPSSPRVLLMSAHYDHLGIVDGEIYNGTDDNASGVVALLETMAWFEAHPPESTIMFVFFDAEEKGIVGSPSLLNDMSAAEKERIALNLNLDMVSRADKGELYAVGGYHFPDLIPLIDKVASEAPLKLLRGHETPDLGPDDWSFASDHAAFLRAGIPIIYLGVEDHADYHKPTDTFDKVDPDMFARSLDTVILMAEAADDWVASAIPTAPAE